MKVCVFASSSSILHEMYFNAASRLGSLLASGGHEIVFGGGNMGLMGSLANAALGSGGRVVGVIPQFMQDEGWGHHSLTQMIVTDDMHSRKKEMFTLSDAVIALPGGIGTLEELSEAITLKQLGIFKGPVVILNTLGFYDHLLAMLDKMISDSFLRTQHRDIWTVADSPEDALDKIENYRGWISNPRGIAKI